MSELPRIVIGSQNPVKSNAVLQAFRTMTDSDALIETVPAKSDVSDQPTSDNETQTGASNRALAARDAVPQADFWIGVEGGIEDLPWGMVAFAWIVVIGKDRKSGRARSAAFPLPDNIAELIRQGVELGHAVDQVFGEKNSKQKGGAIGLLTKGKIDRQQLYEPAAMMAFIPVLNPDQN